MSAAAATFDDLGTPTWAARARAEEARIGLRPPAADSLTDTEQRVIELVSPGRANCEVAEALFISPNTVESNLSTIYRKLGVRSRTELATHRGQRQR